MHPIVAYIDKMANLSVNIGLGIIKLQQYSRNFQSIFAAQRPRPV
jgi:hypothetical protein